MENPVSACFESSYLLAVELHNRNTLNPKTCQQHKPTKYIMQAGLPSPPYSYWYKSLVLSVGLGQHCIIKPLLLSWHIALHCFHESYVSTEPWRCPFECQIRNIFGQTTNSALMIENWRDGSKAKGVWGRKKAMANTGTDYMHKCTNTPSHKILCTYKTNNNNKVYLVCRPMYRTNMLIYKNISYSPEFGYFTVFCKDYKDKKTLKGQVKITNFGQMSQSSFLAWSRFKSFTIGYLPISDNYILLFKCHSCPVHTQATSWQWDETELDPFSKDVLCSVYIVKLTIHRSRRYVSRSCNVD